MKKIIFAFLFLLSASFYQAQTRYYSPKVTSAVVYLNGATLTQSVNVNFKKGNNQIVLTDLATGIDEKTITVKVKGGVQVLAVNKMLNHIRKGKREKEVKALQDSLDFYEQKRSDLNAEIKVLQQKLSLFSNLIQKGSKKQSLTEIRKKVDYYSSFSSKVNFKIEKDKRLFRKVDDKIKKIKEQLKELNSLKAKPVNEVELTVNAGVKTSSVVEVTYFTRSASWTPFYNVISKGFGKKVLLVLNAEIKQKTGLAWRDYKLTLSTRNPYLSNNKPKLSPWFIDFAERNSGVFFKSAAKVEAAVPASAFVSEKSKDLSTEFAVNEVVPIKPDGKGRIVKIKQKELTGKYYYSVVPKLSGNGFLVCEIAGWNGKGWLSGMANIFYENSYIGKSYINPKTTGKNFVISLGRDENIKAEKNVVKDFKEESLIGSNVTRTFVYNIVIKNNKNKTVSVIAEDQVPVSKNEKIEVEVKEKNGAKFFPKNGKLVWHLKLKPGERKILKLEYSVTYPGNKEIFGL